MDKNIVLAKSSLERNGFTVKTFKNIVEAKEALLKEIQVSESIAFGGSMTLLDMELYEDFKERGNEIFWHWKTEDRSRELDLARNSHIYITSTNALTLDGKLVCMDGVGNRVSSMFYGHKGYIL